jgi:hypothetical protein
VIRCWDGKHGVLAESLIVEDERSVCLWSIRGFT